MYSFINCITSVNTKKKNHFVFVYLFLFYRYLLQFYLNFFRNSPSCSLVHFAPHLLKTCELFNYSFNVFISIVSGKHGRHELLNMLLCRTKKFHSKLHSPSTHHSSVLTKLQYQQRTNHKTDEQINTTHKLLLSNNYS
jgi:hypothetical protein